MPQMPWDTKPTTAIVQGCTVADYDKARTQFMGSHLLELFRFSPRQCQWKIQGLIPSSTTSYYEIGTALHCFVLEGAGAFHERYEIAEGPINPKTGNPYGRDTKAFSTWYEEITATGRQVVSGSEFTQIQMMSEAINETAARDLLQYGLPEVTIRGQLHGVQCQSRLDWLDTQNMVLVDLKTTESLSRFEKDFWKYGYNRQLAFYRGMVQGLQTGKDVQVYCVAVEKQEPHRTHCWQLTEATLADADEQNKQNLLQFRQLVAGLGWERPWPLSLEFGRSIGTL